MRKIERIEKIALGVAILLIVGAVGYINSQSQKNLPRCDSDHPYIRVDETTGMIYGGGECYCPVDKNLAVWVDAGQITPSIEPEELYYCKYTGLR